MTFIFISMILHFTTFSVLENTILKFPVISRYSMTMKTVYFFLLQSYSKLDHNDLQI